VLVDTDDFGVFGLAVSLELVFGFRLAPLFQPRKEGGNMSSLVFSLSDESRKYAYENLSERADDLVELLSGPEDFTWRREGDDGEGKGRQREVSFEHEG